MRKYSNLHGILTSNEENKEYNHEHEESIVENSSNAEMRIVKS